MKEKFRSAGYALRYKGWELIGEFYEHERAVCLAWAKLVALFDTMNDEPDGLIDSGIVENMQRVVGEMADIERGMLPFHELRIAPAARILRDLGVEVDA